MIPVHKLSGRLGNQMFQLAYLHSQQAKGLIPDIYVQSEEYFEPIKEHIKQLFSEGIEYSDKVSIHVRRGDYVGHPFYVDLTLTDYYERAMTLFPNRSFLVFSDDIEWCKAQPLFKGCDFSVGKTEIDDFNLQAGCDGHIIANSSYSWWAAYLGRGQVVAPKAWHPDGIARTKLPSNWIVI